MTSRNKTCLPKKISLFIGGFTSIHEYSLFFDGKQMFYGTMVGEKIPISLPSEQNWRKFWNKLDELNVWQWERNYHNNDILDGTQWEVIIIFDKDKKVISYGSNEYPKGFSRFLLAVRELIGWLEFR